MPMSGAMYKNISSKCFKIKPCHAEEIKMPRTLLIFSQSDNLNDKQCRSRLVGFLPSESESALFAKAGYIRVQQDQV